MQPASDPTRTEDPSAGQAFPVPAIGSLVAERYRIVRSIADGGMGSVFEAQVISVGGRCALKFLRRELAVRARSAARFEREAQLLGRLQHEHLTAMLDYGLYLGQSPFLVMEYLEGHTLKRLLEKDGCLPLPRSLAILLQLARGMAFVHAQKIVHRDLKPENLMLLKRSDGQDWLKIMDFGIARDLEGAGGSITRSGAELGTAHYMSPEQARGTRTLTPSSDVYAIGAIAYELLTGERVHTGDSYNAVIYQLLTRPHRPLVERFPECPPHLAALIERCLEKDPAQRPPDADALHRELAAIRLTDSERSVPTTLEVRRNPGRVGRAALGVAALLAAGACGMRLGAARPPGAFAARSASSRELSFCLPAPSREGAAAATSDPASVPSKVAEAGPGPAPKSELAREPAAASVSRPPPAVVIESRGAISRAARPHHDGASVIAGVTAVAPSTEQPGSEGFPFVTANPYGEP